MVYDNESFTFFSLPDEIGPSGFHSFGFCNSNFLYRARTSALPPAPNLVDQVSIFLSPSDTVAKLCPQHRIPLPSPPMTRTAPPPHGDVYLYSYKNINIDFNFALLRKFCGLVAGVPSNRSRDPGFDSRRYQIL
jgi:hypothetical protein